MVESHNIFIGKKRVVIAEYGIIISFSNLSFLKEDEDHLTMRVGDAQQVSALRTGLVMFRWTRSSRPYFSEMPEG